MGEGGNVIFRDIKILKLCRVLGVGCKMQTPWFFVYVTPSSESTQQNVVFLIVPVACILLVFQSLKIL